MPANRPARGHLTLIASGPDPDQFTVVSPIHSLRHSCWARELRVRLYRRASIRHLVLRRWDGAGVASTAYDDIKTPGMNLGDGVHIQFSVLACAPAITELAAWSADLFGGAVVKRSTYWNHSISSSMAVVARDPATTWSPSLIAAACDSGSGNFLID